MGYPQKPMPRPRVSPRAKGQEEQSEALTAFRNGEATDKVAVTRGDLAKQGDIKLLANKITAAPTIQNYNDLVEDLRQIASLLNQAGAKFNGF